MKLNLIFAIITFILLSCTNSTEPCSCSKKTFYQCTFNSSGSLTGWKELSSESIFNDSTDEVIRTCVNITGGCCQPATFLRIPVVKTGEYTLSCWARVPNTDNHATIIMKKPYENEFQDTLIPSIKINSPYWNNYYALNSKQFKAGDTLEIDIIVGGFIPETLYLDELLVQYK